MCFFFKSFYYGFSDCQVDDRMFMKNEKTFTVSAYETRGGDVCEGGQE